MTPALMVGSRPTWLAKLRPHLASVGIEVRWCWENRGDHRSGLPSGCQLMLIATDCNSHTLGATALTLARSAGLRTAHISHRWAQAATVLAQIGFAPTPIDTPAPTPEVEITPTTENQPMPEIMFTPAYKLLQPAERTLVDTILPYLADNPWLTTPEVATKIGKPVTHLWPITKVARESLGIKAGVGSGAARIIDRARYEQGCEAMGMTPFEGNIGPTRMRHVVLPKPPAPQSAVIDTDGWDANRDTIASDPTPAPVFTSTPATQSGTPNTLAALRLLLDEMRAEGVEEIVISANGRINVRRRIVVTDELSI